MRRFRPRLHLSCRLVRTIPVTTAPAPAAALGRSGSGGLGFARRRFTVSLNVYLPLLLFSGWRRCGALRRGKGSRAIFQLPMPSPLDLERSRKHVVFCFELDREIIFGFEMCDFASFLVHRVDCDFCWRADRKSGRSLSLRFFLQAADDAQRGRFNGTDDSLPAAMRAGNRRSCDNARAQALPRHFEQPELADAANLHTRAVILDRIAQTLLDVAVVARVLHVDEVDDDQPGQIA